MSDDGEKQFESKGEKGKESIEKKAGVRAGGEAAGELSSGSLNAKNREQKQEQFKSGRSGVSGLFENDGNGGLPRAKDLLGDLAHKPLTKEQEKTVGEMKSKSEQGLLMGAGGEFVEPKDGSDKVKIADKTHEKLVPKDGDQITLKQLLNDYKTPFIDAYEHSKQVKDGEPGKSKTLEEVVDRLKSCPWADLIRIKFDSHANNPEYNNELSRITIKPQEPAWQQIDTFAHEGFHATHQTLKELYLREKAISLPDYVRVKGDAEVGSFETEVKVHKELGLPGKVLYQWNDSHNVPQTDKDLGALYEKGGRAGLEKFILSDAYTKMLIHQQFEKSNYHHYHESTYSDYVAGFHSAKESLGKLLKNNPAAEERILEKHF